MRKAKYEIGNIVYLKVDPEQYPRIVVGINIRPEGITYVLKDDYMESEHYEMEIQQFKNITTSFN